MMMCSQRCRQLYTTVFVLCAFMISSPLMSQTTADSQPVAKTVAAYPQVFSRQSDQTASDGTLNNRQTVGAGVINADPVTAIAGLLLVVLLIFAIVNTHICYFIFVHLIERFRCQHIFINT